jgi:predicted nucleic-acid-binding protein
VIAIDSNILIRYLVQDDPAQATLATKFLEEELTAASPGLVTVVALCETVWALRRVYRVNLATIRSIMAELVAAPNLVIEHETEVEMALNAGAEFADVLLHSIAQYLGAAKTMTFDRKFARTEGVELLGS